VKTTTKKYRYGSTNSDISMTERSTEISIEGAMESFKNFTPPPWESIKEFGSRSLRLLLEVGSLRILLKFLGVNGKRLFPLTTTHIVLIF
jgi:hypothetical protein